MALGADIRANAIGTNSTRVYSTGISSTPVKVGDAGCLSVSDTGLDAPGSLARSVMHDMTFDGSEGEVIALGALYPAAMSSPTTDAVIVAFGYHADSGIWTRLETPSGAAGVTLAAVVASDPKDSTGTSRFTAPGLGSRCFLRGGALRVRFAVDTAIDAGSSGEALATLWAWTR